MPEKNAEKSNFSGSFSYTKRLYFRATKIDLTTSVRRADAQLRSAYTKRLPGLLKNLR